MLTVRDLRTYFKTEDGLVKAVNGVSFHIDSGETFAIVGESGCGKSVTAFSVMGIVPSPPGRVVGGSIEFDGQMLLDYSEKQMQQVRGGLISMVFQEPMSSLNPVFTCGNQIVEAISLHQNIYGDQAEQLAINMLAKVGIPAPDQRFREYPHQMSGGMKQRVMIAMALSCNPKLLIADEPTTALDVTIQAQIVDLVKRLQEQLGMAVMWITHDLGVAASLVKTINVMYAGYLIERGRVKDIFKRPRHPYTRGLLSSLPRLDQKPGSRLTSIPGNPPSLIGLTDGCPFVPRCTYAQEQCQQAMPALEATGEDGRTVACWRWNEIAD